MLDLVLETCRHLYNVALADRKNAYEQEGKSVSYYETKKLLPQWKEDKPELKGVHSQVLQEVVKRVDLAYQAFFRRVRDSEDPGYPRFKGYGRYDSFTYTQTGFSLKPGKLWLSKIGDIKGMVKNHCLAKHIADAAWNKLITTTAYKAEWAGKRVELVKPNGTSQICSGCGQVVQKS